MVGLEAKSLHFGILCFKHVYEQLRKKFDENVESMLLIYCYTIGVYQFTIQKTRRFI